MRSIIESAWENRSLLADKSTIQAIEHVIEELDKGIIRVAEQSDSGEWTTNEWVKKAVILYFPIGMGSVITVNLKLFFEGRNQAIFLLIFQFIIT